MTDKIIVDEAFHEAIRCELLQDVNPCRLTRHVTIKNAAFVDRTPDGAEVVVVTADDRILLYEVSVVGRTIGGRIGSSEEGG